MRSSRRPLLLQSLLALVVAFGPALPARADDAARAPRVALLPSYQQECAACHMAYPPGMLPAAAWTRLMDNLPRHFGTDASLDPATVRELSIWLGTNAGGDRRGRAPPPEDRITRSALVRARARQVAAGGLEASCREEPRQLHGLPHPGRQGSFR